MTSKGLFFQNVIAVIWDFDRTLSPHYMQKPLFAAYGVDEAKFWDETNQLPGYYARAGVRVHPDTCYLGHILSYVNQGRLPDLTNARLRELGADIEFFPGLPEIFDRLTAIPRAPVYADADLHLEHYVVSTGLAEMIRGSAIADKLSGIWASEFIEAPAGPGTDLAGTPSAGPISQIAYFLDNTTKTRALFEINKGVNKEKRISVNDTIPEEDRRVPFKNMIYIADGPSDVPSFSVVKKHGGQTLAVYNPRSPITESEFAQVTRLLEDKRVDMIGPADYREGSQTELWLRQKIVQMASRMIEDRKKSLDARVSRSPKHLTDPEPPA